VGKAYLVGYSAEKRGTYNNRPRLELCRPAHGSSSSSSSAEKREKCNAKCRPCVLCFSYTHLQVSQKAAIGRPSAYGGYLLLQKLKDENSCTRRVWTSGAVMKNGPGNGSHELHERPEEAKRGERPLSK
jgi:hypothetical protein